eukprot:GHVU01102990.1.p1 GENE.GHVU01102990.1~~GHVU01102990.1.p1  ORF type:complete len:572 (+),score=70.44 GHVU01102990.1:3334-5049(+)
MYVCYQAIMLATVEACSCRHRFVIKSDRDCTCREAVDVRLVRSILATPIDHIHDEDPVLDIHSSGDPGVVDLFSTPAVREGGGSPTHRSVRADQRAGTAAGGQRGGERIGGATGEPLGRGGTGDVGGQRTGGLGGQGRRGLGYAGAGDGGGEGGDQGGGEGEGSRIREDCDIQGRGTGELGGEVAGRQGGEEQGGGQQGCVAKGAEAAAGGTRGEDGHTSDSSDSSTSDVVHGYAGGDSESDSDDSDDGDMMRGAGIRHPRHATAADSALRELESDGEPASEVSEDYAGCYGDVDNVTYLPLEAIQDEPAKKQAVEALCGLQKLTKRSFLTMWKAEKRMQRFYSKTTQLARHKSGKVLSPDKGVSWIRYRCKAVKGCQFSLKPYFSNSLQRFVVGWNGKHHSHEARPVRRSNQVTLTLAMKERNRALTRRHLTPYHSTCAAINATSVQLDTSLTVRNVGRHANGIRKRKLAQDASPNMDGVKVHVAERTNGSEEDSEEWTERKFKRVDRKQVDPVLGATLTTLLEAHGVMMRGKRKRNPCDPDTYCRMRARNGRVCYGFLATGEQRRKATK